MKTISKKVEFYKKDSCSQWFVKLESIGNEQVQVSELIYHDEGEDPNYREHSITSSEIAILEHVTDPQIEMLENCTCLGELKNVLSRNFAVYLDEFL